MDDNIPVLEPQALTNTCYQRCYWNYSDKEKVLANRAMQFSKVLLSLEVTERGRFETTSCCIASRLTSQLGWYESGYLSLTGPCYVAFRQQIKSLQLAEDIDFEFVYALHTFVATVEGQANATKGDTMVLLDDSNSYWWLVRIVKDSSIGNFFIRTVRNFHVNSL